MELGNNVNPAPQKICLPEALRLISLQMSIIGEVFNLSGGRLLSLRQESKHFHLSELSIASLFVARLVFNYKLNNSVA